MKLFELYYFKRGDAMVGIDGNVGKRETFGKKGKSGKSGKSGKFEDFDGEQGTPCPYILHDTHLKDSFVGRGRHRCSAVNRHRLSIFK